MFTETKQGADIMKGNGYIQETVTVQHILRLISDGIS